MPERLEHIRFTRSEPVKPRRTRRYFPPTRAAVADPAAHARALLAGLTAPANAFDQFPGFDPRQLVKIEVDQLSPDELERIPGLRVVAQEDEAVIVAFLSEQGRAEFEARLERLSRGQRVVRRELLLAMRAVDTWGSEDRIGVTLRGSARGALGAPGTFALDVELWPLEQARERNAMVAAFSAFCVSRGMELRDSLNRENVVLARVRVTSTQAQELLRNRDVRFVDLPPRLGLRFELLTTGLSQFPPIPSPDQDAPRVAVLDSGVISGHPLLAPAIGDSQSFLAARGPEDEDGHGTMVSGVALYGDVAGCIEARSFTPRHWIVSGRILDHQAEAEDLVESQIVKAVEYFTQHYGCRLFNLSVGDSRRPFGDGRPGPWATLLDDLAKKHNVLFIVSTGNYRGSANGPDDWRAAYPGILLSDDEARIIDPGTAINAITVGGLALYERSRQTQRHPDDPAHQPIARSRMPSPFTRAGPGVLGAIKPEFVEHAGNSFVNAHTSPHRMYGERDLGVVSLSRGYATGGMFTIDNGTSFASPKVTWLAAKVLAMRPAATNDLLRSLIGVHASVPDETTTLLGGDEEPIRRLVGYGLPSAELSLDSTESCVTLYAEDELGEDAMHFYELPVPEDCSASGRCTRRVSVALAHTAGIRSTRIDYRKSMFSFRVVRHHSLEGVVRAFQRVSEGDEVDAGLPEVSGFRPTMKARSLGTLQATTLVVKQPSAAWRTQSLFVVVTRRVPVWAREQQAPTEKYAMAVAFQDLSEVEVRLHTQVREKLRARVRIRT